MRFLHRLLDLAEARFLASQESNAFEEASASDDLYRFDFEQVLGGLDWIHFPLGRLHFPDDIEFP